MAVERVDLLGGPALEGAHDVLLALLTSVVQGRLAVLLGDLEQRLRLRPMPYSTQTSQSQNKFAPPQQA